MSHPYRSQPARAFWKRTISDRHPLDIADWYQKRFDLTDRRIATAGSCFAQHIGRHLRTQGFAYLDTEPRPEALAPEVAQSFGYGVYSARYGNVYTSRQLLQLLRRALGTFQPQEQPWAKGEGVVDPFRPTIEPEPFSSQHELDQMRSYHLDCVAELFSTAEVFIFTLGLTETWQSRHDGAAFPLCPGTEGGTFDPALYAFHNLTASEVRQDLETFLAELRAVNPGVKVILTVSPVPLMATATSAQVAVASSYSKSVLRAAAGEMVENHLDVDYFPSYEIITAPFMKGYFFESDGRQVSHHGVSHVMKQFFAEHLPKSVATTAPAGPTAPSAVELRERLQCDEELLAAFGPPDGEGRL